MEKELLKIIKVFNKHRLDYLLIGGMAAILYGVKRATFDIDVAVALDSISINKAKSLLKKMRFWELSPEISKIDPRYGIGFTNGRVDVDLMYIEEPNFSFFYQYCTKLKYKGIIIKIPNIMDLVHIKEASPRDKDKQDAEALRYIISSKKAK